MGKDWKFWVKSWKEYEPSQVMNKGNVCQKKMNKGNAKEPLGIG